MATQTQPSQRKIRWSAPAPTQPPCPQAQPYRRRRPENTTLHRIVREHLETYLALAEEVDPMGDGVPTHVENEFRSYLKCGILYVQSDVMCSLPLFSCDIGIGEVESRA